MRPLTVPEFCKISLKRLLVSNDTPSPKVTPAQLQDAITEYNLIADSWGADGSMIYTQQFYTFPLVGGQQTYTIGANNVVGNTIIVADFNTGTQPRPSYLEYASFQQTTSNPPADLPMRVVDADEWASIVTKNIQTNIGFYVYMDGAWPQANLNIWPAPSISANIVLTTWLSFNSNVGESDTISLPPAYARGLSLDLSIAMAPYYGKSGDPSVAQMASTLAKIKKDIGWTNIRGGRLTYSDGAQGSRGLGGTYDAISDQIL
jgi:hypothetical protein